MVVASGYTCGGFIGSLVCMFFTLSFMPEWGWRMSFILEFFISLFGLYLRKNILETPEFKSIKKAEIEPKPLAKSLADNRLQLLIYFLFSGIGGAMYYMNFVYFIAFTKDYAIISNNQAQLYCSLGVGAAIWQVGIHTAYVCSIKRLDIALLRVLAVLD